MSWTAWNPAPFVLVGAAVTLALFADAFVRLRRRGRRDHASWSRAALFLLAVALGTLSLVSPLDEAGDSYLLSAHMLQHVLVADAAPALALVALRGPLLFFFLPSPIVRWAARSTRVRGALAFLLRPRVSLAAWALVIAGWHVPAAYDYALARPLAHDVEHLSFIAVGLLAWTQIVDPARRGSLTRSQRLGCALGMSVFAAVLGGLLVLTAPLYPAYAGTGTRLFGLSPAADQQLAGLVMVAEQLAALALVAAVLLPTVGRKRAEPRRPEAGGHASLPARPIRVVRPGEAA